MDVPAQPIETLEYLPSRRHSCRAFKQTPVARKSILRIPGVAEGRVLVQQPTLADSHNERRRDRALPRSDVQGRW
jgi:hypothetical protein